MSVIDAILETWEIKHGDDHPDDKKEPKGFYTSDKCFFCHPELWPDDE